MAMYYLDFDKNTKLISCTFTNSVKASAMCFRWVRSGECDGHEAWTRASACSTIPA